MLFPASGVILTLLLRIAVSGKRACSCHTPRSAALLKPPAADPASVFAWTYSCMFHAFTSKAYEEMVRSVQSVLKLPYQPDETSSINQVFFTDPAKSAKRVFVSKANEATIGLSVVAVTSASAPSPDPNAALFSGAAATPATEPTIRGEIEKVRGGKYTPLPPKHTTGAGASRNGMAVFEVKNDTAYGALTRAVQRT